jgi:hypothetical protein
MQEGDVREEYLSRLIEDGDERNARIRVCRYLELLLDALDYRLPAADLEHLRRRHQGDVEWQWSELTQLCERERSQEKWRLGLADVIDRDDAQEAAELPDPNVLITQRQWHRMNINHRIRHYGEHVGKFDPRPVVKLIAPDGTSSEWGPAVWLLSDICDDGTAYGFYDLGYGSPELGTVYMSDIRGMRGLVRDVRFVADRSLSGYVAATDWRIAV